MNRKVNWIAVLASLVQMHALVTISACYAGPNPNLKTDVTQQKSKEPEGKKPTKPGEFYKRSAKVFKSDDLVQMPNLREVPLYTGSNVEFGWGEEFPNSSGGKVTVYVFSTSDPQNTVIQWYQKYLTGIGWTVEPVFANSQNGAGAIEAHKGQSVCQISTESDDDNRISVRVHYHGATN